MNERVLYLNSSSFAKGILPNAEGVIDSIMIEGHASTIDPDRADDVIPASAWEKGITEYLKNPIILAFHNYSKPVGKMVDYRIDEQGLWIAARISAASEKVFNLVKDEIITAFSVGFRILDAEYRPEVDLFIIKELELHEISLVSVGMNSNALFNLSKAFDSAEDYTNFKLQFAKKETPAKGLGNLDKVESATVINNEEDIDMTKEELAEIVSKALAAQKAEDAKESASKAAELAAKAAEEADITKRIDAAVKAATASKIDTSAPSGAEQLLADIDARIKAATDSNKVDLEALQAEVREKTAELEAIQKSKMIFVDKGSKDEVSYQEKENAFLLGQITRKGMTGTKYGQALVEKVGGHVASATWELEVSTRMESEIRRKLVIAPLFRSIPMQTNVMTIPVNPEAGLATWVTNAQFGTTSSTGAAQTHQLGEITLNAYKVATLEYLNYEEEEDSLLVLLPMIRDAMIRRLARAIDKAYLRGAGSGADPVKGIALYDAASAVTNPVATAVTVAKLNLLRKDLGAWGLDPSELRFLVSTQVYYDLLEDTVFQTVDKVADRATLLTGQIGEIGQTPVLVSAEFDTLTIGNDAAICIAPANFIAGNQRGLRFETGDLIETQRKAMVASLRTGLIQVTTAQGMGVSALEYVA